MFLNMDLDSLNLSKDIYRFIVENSPISLVVGDFEGNFLFVNDAFTLHSGFTSEEALSINFLDRIEEGENKERIKNIFPEIAQGNPFKDIDYLFTTKNGETLHLSSDITPVSNKNGIVVGFLAATINVSQQKMNEKIKIELEKLESLGNLAAGLAHAYNNILLGILGNVNLLQLNNENLDREFLLEEIEASVSRAHRLTNQLLTFTKGGKPKKDLIDVHSLIRNQVKRLSKSSNCNFILNKNAIIPKVEADVGQLEIAFHNLLKNADEAMDEGGEVKIDISLEEIEGNMRIDPGNYVLVSIRDMGGGIPETYLTKMFAPQFDTYDAKLGLATTFSIIKHHDGIIEYATDEEGTCFEIYLPASKRKRSRRKRTGTQREKFEGKVLLLDDDETILFSIDKILAHLGLAVSLTTTGEETIKMYEYALKMKEPYDLVILDLTIPNGMGGKETMEKLRIIDPHACVVVSSGYSNDAVMANYKDFGFRDILPKPYDINQLRDMLDRVL